jgi:Glucan phosphorylase
MPALCLCFSIHEPYQLRRYTVFDMGQSSVYEDDDQNCDALLRAARLCYLPACDLLLKLVRRYAGAFAVSLSISGTALDLFEQYTPEVTESLCALAETGCVEFVAATSAHSLAFLYSREEFDRQVKAQCARLKGLFGKKPTAFMAIPLVGVGLLYKNGYFRQDIDADGRQVAQYPVNNFGLLPISMVYDADKQPVFVQLELPGRLLFARVWKLCVGRITLYLMDTDTRRNTDEDRRITDKLYEANREVRLLQEMLLGMKSLLVGVDGAVVPGLASGYCGSGDALQLPIAASVAIAMGTGNLEASPKDIVRLVNLDRVLKDNVLELLPLRPLVLSDGKEAAVTAKSDNYLGSELDGCTLFLFNEPKIDLIGKLGTFPGFGNVFFYDRQTGYAAAISVNNERAVSHAIALGAEILNAIRQRGVSGIK